MSQYIEKERKKERKKERTKERNKIKAFKTVFRFFENQALVAVVNVQFITKTSPCNEHPLTPHFYKVKLGFTGVFFFFLFLLQNIDCGEKYSKFSSENEHFYSREIFL